MKKRVLKRKKTIRIHKKRNLYRAAGRWAAMIAVFCFLTGTVLTAYGEEKSDNTAADTLKKTVITDICHRHVGTSDTKGGCYTDEIEHHHQGDEKSGGECYQIPVLHHHQGDAITGGGCYGLPVLHQHQDGCYAEHVHQESCFQLVECTESYEQVEPFETLEKNCLNHGITTFDRANAVVTHSACGREPANVTIVYCQICGPHITMHTEQEKLCAYEEGELERDNPNCGKESGVTVDGYKENCGWKENETESYGISCGKQIDGYGIGCGLAQGEVLGRLVLTSETDKEGKKAVLSARVEELSSGSLILSAVPYIWQDAQGNIIGNGASVEVADNGNYSVILTLENKDVEEDGLRSTIPVEGIHKEGTNPSPHPTDEPKASPSPSAGGGEGGGRDDERGDIDKEDEKNEETEGEENEGEEESEDENSASIVNVIKKEKSDETGKEIKSLSGSGSGTEGSSFAENNTEKNGSYPTPSTSPQNREKLAKETGTVQAKEKEAAGEIPRQVKQTEKKNGFFTLPAVRIITVTAGTLLLLAGILFLLFYLRRSVRIYNDDGEGRMHYLGRCMIHEKEDVQFLIISDAMVEKSYTNRYCIKPGLYRWGKKEEQELVVYKDAKKAVAALGREMIVII